MFYINFYLQITLQSFLLSFYSVFFIIDFFSLRLMVSKNLLKFSRFFQTLWKFIPNNIEDICHQPIPYQVKERPAKRSGADIILHRFPVSERDGKSNRLKPKINTHIHVHVRAPELHTHALTRTHTHTYTWLREINANAFASLDRSSIVWRSAEGRNTKLEN